MLSPSKIEATSASTCILAALLDPSAAVTLVKTALKATQDFSILLRPGISNRGDPSISMNGAIVGGCEASGWFSWKVCVTKGMMESGRCRITSRRESNDSFAVSDVRSLANGIIDASASTARSCKELKVMSSSEPPGGPVYVESIS